MNIEARQFLAALGAGLQTETERLILCGFPGDPGKAQPAAWRPRPWAPGFEGLTMPQEWNGYVTVGAFTRSPDGSFRRRSANCSAGMALMIDDVGTKVDRSVVSVLEPSARIETSPGNEQWWYILGTPERDPVRFDAIIRAFITGKLLGKDPGMAGVTRVGRLPGYENAKPEYGGWRTKLLEINDLRYTVEDLLAEFDLKLEGRVEPPIWARKGRLPHDVEARVHAFNAVEKFLLINKMLKSTSGPDPSGWTEMHCPWVEEHTGGVDNGAAIREPEMENGFYGGFRCHHGSHQGKAWRDLTDWVNEQAVEQMMAINDAAQDEE